MHQVLTNARTAVESRIAELRWLEEQVHAAEEDSEALREVRARVDELTAECTSLAAGTRLAKA